MAQGEQPRLREQASLWPAQIYVEREAAYPFARLTPSRCRLSSQAVICVFLFLALTASVLKRAPPSHNPHTRRRHLSLGADARSLPPYGAAGECSRRSLAREAAATVVRLTTPLSSACLLAPRSRSSNAAYPGQARARARPRPVPFTCLVTPAGDWEPRCGARGRGALDSEAPGRAAWHTLEAPPKRWRTPFDRLTSSPHARHIHTPPRTDTSQLQPELNQTTTQPRYVPRPIVFERSCGDGTGAGEGRAGGLTPPVSLDTVCVVHRTDVARAADRPQQQSDGMDRSCRLCVRLDRVWTRRGPLKRLWAGRPDPSRAQQLAPRRPHTDDAQCTVHTAEPTVQP